MHELAIAREIVRIATEAAAREGSAQVLTVSVEVGALSGVLPEAMELCFEACARGTSLETARLEIRRVEGQGTCLVCGKEFDLPALLSPCPGCGGYAVRATGGQELRVTSLEVEPCA